MALVTHRASTSLGKGFVFVYLFDRVCGLANTSIINAKSFNRVVKLLAAKNCAKHVSNLIHNSYMCSGCPC
jgi:hypothetical protein